MSTFETEAIILRAYRLSDADKIIVSLTRSAGTVRGVAHGALRLKSRFGASLEPFTHCSLSFYEKEGRELVTVKQAEIIKSYFALSRKPEVVAILEHFSQLVMEFAPPHQPDEKLFRLLVACLDAVSERPDRAESIHPYFELWVLRLMGFLPELKECEACGRGIKPGFETVSVNVEGSVRCGSCDGVGAGLIDPALHKQLASMNQLRPLEWGHRFQLLSDEQRRQLSDLTTRLILRALEKQPLSERSRGRTSSIWHQSWMANR